MRTLLYFFVVVMVLEAFIHGTSRENMLSQEDLMAKLMGDAYAYEDEPEDQ